MTIEHWLGKDQEIKSDPKNFKIIEQDKVFQFKFDFDPHLIYLIKEVPGRKYISDEEGWTIPKRNVRKLVFSILDEPEMSSKYGQAIQSMPSFSEVLTVRKRLELADQIRLLDDRAIRVPEWLKFLDPEKPGQYLTLRPYQYKGLLWSSAMPSAILSAEAGLGKAQPLDSKVLTPIGWKQMGDIKIGDKVINSQGTHSNVIGVFPQGKKGIYRITFSDGSQVESTEDHLWNIQSHNERARNQGFKTKQLKEFMNDFKTNLGRRKCFIPMVSPVHFNYQPVSLDPYLLGLLIGNGGMSAGTVYFTDSNLEKLESVNTLIPIGVSVKNTDRNITVRLSKTEGRKGGSQLKNPLTNSLQELGLMGKLSKEKFIPDVYKFNSLEIRLALFQGLMDTDGSVYDNTTMEFCSASKRLAEDVVFLVQSFGGTAKLKYKKTSWSYKGIKKYGEAWRVMISLPNEIKPFRVKVKANKLKERTKYSPYRAIEKIEYIGKKMCQCIAVDSSDSLYVTDNFILTHNTLIGLSWIRMYKRLTGIQHPKAIIFSPANAMFSAWNKWLKCFPDLDSFGIAFGSKADRKEVYKSNPDILVVSYDIMPDRVRKAEGTEVVVPSFDWPYLEERVDSTDLLLSDEVTMVSNKSASRSIRFNKIIQDMKRMLLLTGTPIMNKLNELHRLGYYVDSTFFESWKEFERNYMVTDVFGKPVRYKNLEELHERSKRIMYRILKSEVDEQLPEKIHQEILVDMSAEQRKVYNQVRDEAFVIIDQIPEEGSILSVDETKKKFLDVSNALAKATRLEQICSSLKLLNSPESSNPKLAELKRLLKIELDEKQVIVFTQSSKMAKFIQQELEDFNPLLLTGETNAKERAELEHQFQHDSKYKVFITTKAGGMALTLTKAYAVIFYDLLWNPQLMNQVMDRSQRIGSEYESILIIWLLTRNSIQIKKKKVTEKKEMLLSAVGDGDENALAVLQQFTKKELQDLFSDEEAA